MLFIVVENNPHIKPSLENQVHVAGLYQPQDILLRLLEAEIRYLYHNNRTVVDVGHHPGAHHDSASRERGLLQNVAWYNGWFYLKWSVLDGEWKKVVY